MDANQTPKKKLFICKFCNKKYPCGKSLGGHIRIHLNGHGNGNLIDAEDETDFKLKHFSKDSDTEAAGYGLRENPKKTRRFVADSNQRNLLQGRVCKECGKGFQSMKALCGHMASHSKTSFEDQSETTEKLKDHVFDSQSDTETSSIPSKRRRSTRMRYKAVDVYSSLPNASVSDVSDDVELEQEEVAMCLMMLSRDSGFKGCFAATTSLADFSDSDSVFVETKSSPSVKNGINCAYNANRNGHFEKSDYGYFRNGPKKVEPETSVDDEFKKQKMGYGCKYEEEHNPEIAKRLTRVNRIKTEFGKDESEIASRKRGRNYDSYQTEFHKEKASKTGKSPYIGADRTNNGYESDENSIETERVPNRKKIQSCNGKRPIVQNAVGSKKGKVHECPFCDKVYRSGQALGGHKRSHFVRGSEDTTLVIDHHRVPEVSMSGIIDLNLPAPMEEDTNGYYLASW